VTGVMLHCPCRREETTKRVSSSVDVAILSRPVFNLVRWDEIREELCVSNVIQRDSIMFATKLHPCLVDLASANEKEAKDVKFWTLGARREMVRKLLSEWLVECEDEATVEVLLSALSHENFTDVKIKVEEMINVD